MKSKCPVLWHHRVEGPKPGKGSEELPQTMWQPGRGIRIKEKTARQKCMFGKPPESTGMLLVGRLEVREQLKGCHSNLGKRWWWWPEAREWPMESREVRKVRGPWEVALIGLGEWLDIKGRRDTRIYGLGNCVDGSVILWVKNYHVGQVWAWGQLQVTDETFSFGH